jgi:hypothetical protein
MSVIFDIVFAFTESIPQFNSFVTRTRHDLSVVSTEADRKNIGGMADKTTCCETCVKIPKTQCVIPGRRKGKLAVRGDHNIRDKVVVAMKNSFWVAVGIFLAGQLPNDDGFVSRSSKDHVRVF